MLIKKLGCCLLIWSLFACIPYKIAPNIEGDKVMKAKKFKKNLPNFYGFIFEDKKNAYEFYNFINTKYDLKHHFVEANVPIIINKSTYYLSFFERERTTETVNLIPIAVDTGLTNKGNSPMLEDLYTSRSGAWYIILTVTDAELKDCLNPNYPKHQEILTHLKKLRVEYLTTNNYLEAYLKMK